MSKLKGMRWISWMAVVLLGLWLTGCQDEFIRAAGQAMQDYADQQEQSPGQPAQPQGSPGQAIPGIVRFEFDPPQIIKGGSTTLIWATQHADRVVISGGIGQVAPSGWRRMSPEHRVAYEITATDLQSSVSSRATATLTIMEPLSGDLPTPGGPALDPRLRPDIIRPDIQQPLPRTVTPSWQRQPEIRRD